MNSSETSVKPMECKRNQTKSTETKWYEVKLRESQRKHAEPTESDWDQVTQSESKQLNMKPTWKSVKPSYSNRNYIIAREITCHQVKLSDTKGHQMNLSETKWNHGNPSETKWKKDKLSDTECIQVKPSQMNLKLSEIKWNQWAN